jgi:hypothetical protein
MKYIVNSYLCILLDFDILVHDWQFDFHGNNKVIDIYYYYKKSPKYMSQQTPPTFNAINTTSKKGMSGSMTHQHTSTHKSSSPMNKHFKC